MRGESERGTEQGAGGGEKVVNGPGACGRVPAMPGREEGGVGGRGPAAVFVRGLNGRRFDGGDSTISLYLKLCVDFHVPPSLH